jgi:hypothetical protein
MTINKLYIKSSGTGYQEALNLMAFVMLVVLKMQVEFRPALLPVSLYLRVTAIGPKFNLHPSASKQTILQVRG